MQVSAPAVIAATTNKIVLFAFFIFSTSSKNRVVFPPIKKGTATSLSDKLFLSSVIIGFGWLPSKEKEGKSLPFKPKYLTIQAKSRLKMVV